MIASLTPGGRGWACRSFLGLLAVMLLCRPGRVRGGEVHSPALPPVAFQATRQPELRGVLIGGQDPADWLFSIAIINGSEESNPGWKKRGEVVQGFIIREYIRPQETLFLENELGEILKLRLNKPVIASSEIPPVTHEQAVKFLDSLINSTLAESKKFPVKAVLDFDVYATATPAQREYITTSRQSAEANGHILMVARNGDGLMRAHEMKPLPRANIPKPVRENLTEEDWVKFQASYAAARFQWDEDRRASEKAKTVK